MPKKHEINFGCIEVGQAVCVTFIAPDAGTIVIDFFGEGDNIVFHTSIRYSDADFVLNTLTDGSWGVEERPAGFLFAHGKAIEMRYELTADGFNIACNGNYITLYKHRMQVSFIKGVHVGLDTDTALCKAKLQSIDINTEYCILY